MYLAAYYVNLFTASVPFVCFDVGASEPAIVCEEQRSGSRSPPAEISGRWPGVCRLGGGMVR